MSVQYFPPIMSIKVCFRNTIKQGLFEENYSCFSGAVQKIMFEIDKDLPNHTFIRIYERESAFSIVLEVSANDKTQEIIIRKLLDSLHFNIKAFITSETGSSIYSHRGLIKNGHSHVLNIFKEPALDYESKRNVNIFQPTKGASKGSVYILHDPISGWYKIGKSKNAIKRKKEIERCSARKLYFANLFHLSNDNDSTYSKLEAGLHRLFKEDKIISEWFDLTKNDLKKAVQFANENYKLL